MFSLSFNLIHHYRPESECSASETRPTNLYECRSANWSRLMDIKNGTMLKLGAGAFELETIMHYAH